MANRSRAAERPSALAAPARAAAAPERRSSRASRRLETPEPGGRPIGARPAPGAPPGPGSLRSILVVTDDGRNPSYRPTRAAATGLAARTGAELILYDRSAESRFVDPYPSGPWTADTDGPNGDRLLDATELEPLGRGYLVGQIAEAAIAGVGARAWLPTRPGARGIREAAIRFHPDVVVLPSEADRPSLIDRARGLTLSRLHASLPVPVLTVGPAGDIRFWQLAARESRVEFRARHGIFPVQGRFTDFDIDVRFDEAAPEETSVTARIAAGSIQTGIGLRDRHLRSGAFLDVGHYPFITFRSTSVRGTGGRYLIVGDLSIGAGSRPVVLEGTFLGIEGAPDQRRSARLMATTEIDWREFGLLGGGMFVGRTVALTIDVTVNESLEAGVR